MNAKVLLLLALLPMLPATAQAPAATPNEGALRAVLRPITPGGVTVTAVKLEGTRATISGRSADNAQISDFLRNIDASPVMEMPQLQEIVRVDAESAFTVTTDVQCPTAADAAIDPCRGASPASANPTVHKCTVDGVVTFQSTPCPDG